MASRWEFVICTEREIFANVLPANFSQETLLSVSEVL